MFKDVFGKGFANNPQAAPLIPVFMERNFRGDWVCDGLTTKDFEARTERVPNLLLPVFNLQTEVRVARAAIDGCCWPSAASSRWRSHAEAPQIQSKTFSPGWWAQLTAARDKKVASNTFRFADVLRIVNEGRSRQEAYMEKDGLIMPVYTATGTEYVGMCLGYALLPLLTCWRPTSTALPRSPTTTTARARLSEPVVSEQRQ